MTMNMFAETDEDLPLFSHGQAQEKTLLDKAVEAGYDFYTIEAVTMCVVSGLDGVRRIEEWIDENYSTRNLPIIASYQEALRLYAESIGIEVIENPDTTYDGWYYLRDAIWQRMSPAEQAVWRHQRGETHYATEGNCELENTTWQESSATAA